MLKPVTREQLDALLAEQELSESAVAIVHGWLARGDGAAVYRNEALDSGTHGHCVTVSFGSPAAQIELDEPPQRMPDIGDHIGWKYQLLATHRV